MVSLPLSHLPYISSIKLPGVYSHVQQSLKECWRSEFVVKVFGSSTFLHVRMPSLLALVYKKRINKNKDIQGGSDNTAPSHITITAPLYIISRKLQLAEISTAATYVGMIMCEWRCVITATLYVYFVDHAVPFLHLFDFYEIIFISLVWIIFFWYCVDYYLYAFTYI